MSSMFSKPKMPKPDQELIQRQKRELAEKESEIAERKAVARRASMGRSSLISGAETGIPSRTTLG